MPTTREDRAAATARRAVEAGVWSWDTARAYVEQAKTASDESVEYWHRASVQRWGEGTSTSPTMTETG